MNQCLGRAQNIDIFLLWRTVPTFQLYYTNSWCLGGGFKHFLFSFLFGEDFPFDSYFSDGLKQPTHDVNLSIKGRALSIPLLSERSSGYDQMLQAIERRRLNIRLENLGVFFYQLLVNSDNPFCPQKLGNGLKRLKRRSWSANSIDWGSKTHGRKKWCLEFEVIVWCDEK